MNYYQIELTEAQTDYLKVKFNATNNRELRQAMQRIIVSQLPENLQQRKQLSDLRDMREASKIRG